MNIMKSLWILTRWDCSCELFVLRNNLVLKCANDLEVRTFLNCQWLLFYLGIVVFHQLAKNHEVWTFPNCHFRTQMSFSHLGKIPYVETWSLEFSELSHTKSCATALKFLLVNRFRATREPVQKRDSNMEKIKLFPSG